MIQIIGKIVVTWFIVIFAYIVLAVTMPGITSITNSTATALDATSNMTNYPGTKQLIQAYPVWVWLIPGGLGLCATAVFLRENSSEQVR